MVTERVAAIGRQVVSTLSQDVAGFMSRLSHKNRIDPGLYTYGYSSSGRRKRLHLRIEEDGRGTLFVDVTDVIHLNETAVEIAKYALDGIPMQATYSIIAAGHEAAIRKQITGEIERLYSLVETISQAADSCPTCELTFLESAPLFSLRSQAPYKADLALTYGCNNHCTHCYNEPERFAMPSLAAPDWICVLNTLHKVGVPHIIFTGGEATLHPDLPTLIQYADSLGMVTGLNTNGRRLAKAKYVQQLAAANLNHVQVTVGSHQEAVHNEMMAATAFKQTVIGIRNAISSGLHCITNTTLMRSNMATIEQTIDFLYELGIRTFAMNGMIYSGGGYSNPNAIPEEEMAPLLIRIRDHAADKKMRFLWYTPTEYCRMSPVELEIGAKRCNAGEYSICIEPNGDVLPCQSFYTSAGNILTDDWNTIWYGDLFLSFRERENDPRLAGLPEKCWHCPDISLCGGGCRIEREARSGVQTLVSSSQLYSCGVGCGAGGHQHDLRGSNGYCPPNSSKRDRFRASGSSFVPAEEISIGQNP